jgi:hypothetical protein
MIPSVPIGLITLSSVIKITLKMPFMATPQSVKDGVQWLGLKRPRTSRGPYRSQFVGIVTINDSTNKVMCLRIPDMRTVNVPDHPDMISFMLEISYSDILQAQVFQPTTSMPPEVIVTTVQQFARIGQAGKIPPVFVPSFPVLIT